MYKIRKTSEGVSIKVKYESGETIDRLEMSRFSNADLKCFISDAEIKGRWVVAHTTWDITLSEYLNNNLNFETIILLLKQCIAVVDVIVKNKFLLMYVDFDFEHVWVSNFGALQFLYLPSEEERQNFRFMNFFEKLVKGIKVSNDFEAQALKEIIQRVEKMPFYSSHKLSDIIDYAEKEYMRMLTLKQDSNAKTKEEMREDKQMREASKTKKKVRAQIKENKEAPIGASSCSPHIYNISTGEIMTYNPGDLIVFSDRDMDDIQIC